MVKRIISSIQAREELLCLGMLDQDVFVYDDLIVGIPLPNRFVRIEAEFQGSVHIDHGSDGPLFLNPKCHKTFIISELANSVVKINSGADFKGDFIISAKCNKDVVINHGAIFREKLIFKGEFSGNIFFYADAREVWLQGTFLSDIYLKKESTAEKIFLYGNFDRIPIIDSKVKNGVFNANGRIRY